MGRAISLELAEKGYRVCAVYRSDDESARKLEHELQKMSRESFVCRADVSKQWIRPKRLQDRYGSSGDGLMC